MNSGPVFADDDAASTASAASTAPAASAPERTWKTNPFRIIGTAWVIAGGLVAAVTGPLHLEHGSWAAAYQVLVAGIAQNAFGTAQRALAPMPVSSRTVAAELLTWNVGSMAVIGGTLIRNPYVVDGGGLLLVFALALMIRTVRGKGQGPGWALWLYRILLVVILVSIPIGLTLAHVRAA